MKYQAYLLSAFLLATSWLGAHEETLLKTFELDNPGKLTLKLESAQVDLEATTSKQVEVTITYSMRSSKKNFEKELSKIDLNFDASSEDVSVELKYPSKSGWFSWFRDDKLDIHVAVKLPPNMMVNAATSGGNIDAQGILNDGYLRSSGGNITLTACEGSWLANTSGGNVHTENGKGDFILKTSGGSITGQQHLGDLEMSTSGGSIRVYTLTGDLQARTSGGSIRLENISGMVDARTSGGGISATFSENPTGDCSLRTSGGSIQLTLPASSTFNLDAGTSGGSVSSEFPVEVTGKASHDKLVGPVNGGGPNIIAKTSGGSVRVKNS